MPIRTGLLHQVLSTSGQSPFLFHPQPFCFLAFVFRIYKSLVHQRETLLCLPVRTRCAGSELWQGLAPTKIGGHVVAMGRVLCLQRLHHNKVARQDGSGVKSTHPNCNTKIFPSAMSGHDYVMYRPTNPGQLCSKIQVLQLHFFCNDRDFFWANRLGELRKRTKTMFLDFLPRFFCSANIRPCFGGFSDHAQNVDLAMRQISRSSCGVE